MNIGEKIKDLRKANKLTQQEFANLISVNVQTIRSYEANKYRPKQPVIDRICRAFSLPSFYFNDYINMNLEEANKFRQLEDIAQDNTDTATGDIIYRRDAINEVCKMLKDCFWADDEELDAVETTINNLSSAQPTIEPRRGKWIYNHKHGSVKIWTCSECGWNDIGEFNFCSNCGADMREEKK